MASRVDDGSAASSSYAIAGQACNLWTCVLQDPLVQQIIEYLTSLYQEAVQQGKQLGKNDKKSVYRFFQDNCIGVKDIPVTDLDRRVRYLENKVKNLQRVIVMVLKLNFAVMSVSRANDLSQVVIKSVDKRDFVKQCYERAACQVGLRHCVWFDPTVEPFKRREYFHEAQKAVAAVITHVIIDNLPIDAISAKPPTTFHLQPPAVDRSTMVVVPPVQRRKPQTTAANRKRTNLATEANTKVEPALFKLTTVSKPVSAASPSVALPTVPSQHPDKKYGKADSQSPAREPLPRLQLDNAMSPKSPAPNQTGVNDEDPFATNKKQPSAAMASPLANPRSSLISRNSLESHKTALQPDGVNAKGSLPSTPSKGGSSQSILSKGNVQVTSLKKPSNTVNTASPHKADVQGAVAVSDPAQDKASSKTAPPPQILLMPGTLTEPSKPNGTAHATKTPSADGLGTPKVATADNKTAAAVVGTPRSSAAMPQPSKPAVPGPVVSSSTPPDSKSSELETDIQRSIQHAQQMMKECPDIDGDFDEEFEIDTATSQLSSGEAGREEQDNKTIDV